MQQYLAQWDARDDHIAETAPVRHPERWHFHDQYMDWYRTFTRRWISRRGAVHEAVVDGLEHLWITLGAQQQLGPADTDTFRETVRSMMHATGGMARRIDDPANMPAFAPLGPTHTSWDLEAEDPLEQPAPPAAQRPRHHRPRSIPRPYQAALPAQQPYQPYQQPSFQHTPYQPSQQPSQQPYQQPYSFISFIRVLHRKCHLGHLTMLTLTPRRI
ncbi:hypothetical protein LINGRAPRIM_LOCUS2993 [Linum grandiflorum]